jgi:hypothetical protein
LAKQFYTKKIARLQYITYGYVPLGSRLKILSIPDAGPVVDREALRRLRLSGGR